MVKIGRHSFCWRQQKLSLRNSFIFTDIMRTSHKRLLKKKLVKYTSKIDRENMKELMKYLVHY